MAPSSAALPLLALPVPREARELLSPTIHPTRGACRAWEAARPDLVDGGRLPGAIARPSAPPSTALLLSTLTHLLGPTNGPGSTGGAGDTPAGISARAAAVLAWALEHPDPAVVAEALSSPVAAAIMHPPSTGATADREAAGHDPVDRDPDLTTLDPDLFLPLGRVGPAWRASLWRRLGAEARASGGRLSPLLCCAIARLLAVPSPRRATEGPRAVRDVHAGVRHLEALGAQVWFSWPRITAGLPGVLAQGHGGAAAGDAPGAPRPAGRAAGGRGRAAQVLRRLVQLEIPPLTDAVLRATPLAADPAWVGRSLVLTGEAPGPVPLLAGLLANPRTRTTPEIRALVTAAVVPVLARHAAHPMSALLVERWLDLAGGVSPEVTHGLGLLCALARPEDTVERLLVRVPRLEDHPDWRGRLHARLPLRLGDGAWPDVLSGSTPARWRAHVAWLASVVSRLAPSGPARAVLHAMPGPAAATVLAWALDHATPAQARALRRTRAAGPGTASLQSVLLSLPARELRLAALRLLGAPSRPSPRPPSPRPPAPRPPAPRPPRAPARARRVP